MLWQHAATMVHQYIMGRYISFGRYFSIVIVKDKKFFALNTWLRHVPSRFTQGATLSHQPSKSRPFVGVRIFSGATPRPCFTPWFEPTKTRSLIRLCWKVIPFLPTSAKLLWRDPFSFWTSRKTGRVRVSLGMIWYSVAVCCNRHTPKSMLSNQPCTSKGAKQRGFTRCQSRIHYHSNWHPFERSYRVSSNMFFRAICPAPSNYHLHFFSHSNEVTRIKDTSFQSKNQKHLPRLVSEMYITSNVPLFQPTPQKKRQPEPQQPQPQPQPQQQQPNPNASTSWDTAPTPHQSGSG